MTFALAWTAAIDFVKKPEVSGEGLEASAQGLLTACFHGLGPILGLLGGALALFVTVFPLRNETFSGFLRSSKQIQ